MIIDHTYISSISLNQLIWYLVYSYILICIYLCMLTCQSRLHKHVNYVCANMSIIFVQTCQLCLHKWTIILGEIVNRVCANMTITHNIALFKSSWYYTWNMYSVPKNIFDILVKNVTFRLALAAIFDFGPWCQKLQCDWLLFLWTRYPIQVKTFICLGFWQIRSICECIYYK